MLEWKQSTDHTVRLRGTLQYAKHVALPRRTYHPDSQQGRRRKWQCSHAGAQCALERRHTVLADGMLHAEGSHRRHDIIAGKEG